MTMMTRQDVKQSLISAVIDEMNTQSNMSDIPTWTDIQQHIEEKLYAMYESWWKHSFPFMHYSVRVGVYVTFEPVVVVSWHEDLHNNPEDLEFLFDPARMCNDEDPVDAYQRAMSII